MMALLPGVVSKAQINGNSGIQAASGLNSLGTKVGDRQSQSLGGSCSSGHCRISGGTASGSNLFHRLLKLKTNNNIKKISLDNLIPGSKSKAFSSIILSNIDRNGTYINTPFKLDTSSSDLIILSPGGIEIGSLGRFKNVGTVALSTAENLAIGGETFHYQNSTQADLINMKAVLNLAQSAFSHNQAEAGQISIKVGDLLSIDGDLLLHSVGGVDIDQASANSKGKVKIGGDISLRTYGKVNDSNAPTDSVLIRNVQIDANNLNVDAKGSIDQPLGVFIEETSIHAKNNIDINGNGGNESSSIDNKYLIGTEILNSSVKSTMGDILIRGIGGKGNKKISSGDYDFDNGTGIIIDGSKIDAKKGLIELKGTGSFGSKINFGHGIEIVGSELTANKITARGLSSKASQNGEIKNSNGIDIFNSKFMAKEKIDFIGKAANTNPRKADIITSKGVDIGGSELFTSAGQISIDGKGGSGKSLDLSSGVKISTTALRASSIKISGTGGRTTKLKNSDTSVGIDISAGSTLDTNSNNDVLDTIFISDQIQEQNGDIELVGVGGSGLEDSGGIFSTATIDSAGSILINGQGGSGKKDIYGVALETTKTDIDNGVITAEKKIIVEGKGGTGKNIEDSTGIFLSDVEVNAGSGIYINGEAGSSSGENSKDVYLNGTYIEDTELTVDSSGLLSGIVNPYNANITIYGTPGGSDGTIENSTGTYIERTKIKTNGSINILAHGTQIGRNADLLISKGVDIGESELLTSAGQISIDGTGGSGKSLELSSGVEISKTSLRASKIKIAGTGGTTSKLENSNTSIGIDISTDSTLDTNSNNDDLGSIYISDQIQEQNGDIELIGVGGSGLEDSGGVFSTAKIDSAGSILIKGQGGSGKKDIYGVALETTETDIDNGDLTAKHQIIIEGKGGTGTNIEDSNGIFLSNIAVNSGSGIYINGEAGNSNGEYSEDIYLNGAYIENAELTVDTSNPLSDIANPYDSNIIIRGTPGGSDGTIESSTGTYIERSEIKTKGGIDIFADGSKTKSKILMFGDGIFLNHNTILASSLVLEGYGATPTQPSAKYNNGELIQQSTAGVSIWESNIKIKKKDRDFNNLILINGFSGGGNYNVNGVDLIGSTLSSASRIDINGVAYDINAEIQEGDGISVVDTSLISDSIYMDGQGSAGSSTAASNGQYMSNAFVHGTSSVTLQGTGGNANDIEGIAEAANGISLVGGSIISADGDIHIIGKGGSSEGETSDTNGIHINQSTIEAKGDIDIFGKAGDGLVVSKANGVTVFEGTIDADGDLLINGLGGGTESRSITEARGVEINSSILNVNDNISINGKGGILDDFISDTSFSEANQGIYLEENYIEGGAISFTGNSGDGGLLVTGIEMYANSIATTGDIYLFGKGGAGDKVTLAEGIFSADNNIKALAGNISLEGIGGEANLIENGNGVASINDTISLDNEYTLSINGEGGSANNKIDSINNPGITLLGSTIEGGKAHNFIGQGGNGGQNNTGIELIETKLTADGIISLSGTGGDGINIKRAVGIQIGDEVVESSLKAKAIEITGYGGTSSLKEGAINKDGKDTFEETANNTGVNINNSSLVATSGSISVLGTGGSLSTEDIANPETNTDIEKVSKASFLQGINLTTSEIHSNDAFFISGEAGKPVAGNDNSGTLINQSTLTSGSKAATDNSLDNRIEGKAYSGTNNNFGLSIKATDITSTNQDLALSGRGGLKATGESNFGIYIGDSSSITVGSSSNPSLLNIFGAGGNGKNLTGGILTENTTYEIEGSIKMYGESQGAGGFGDASVEFIQNVDIIVSDDISIEGNNDININKTTIDAGGTTTIDGIGDINIFESNIASGENTNILAGGSIDIVETSINSGQDTNIQAQEEIAIASSQLNATNNIRLQAESISATDIEFNSQEISTISNSVLEGNSHSKNNQLTLNLSGNVNYSPEEQSSQSTNSSNESNDASKNDKADEANESAEKQKQTNKSNTNLASSTKLTAKAIQESHEKSEKMSTDFVSSKLGLKRQEPVSIQDVQRMLTSGQHIMNR